MSFALRAAGGAEPQKNDLSRSCTGDRANPHFLHDHGATSELKIATMHLRLVHTLSLLLLGVILAAVLAFGGMLAWNLRNGFNDYMVARDTERLEQFAALIAVHLQRSGGLDAFTNGGMDLRQLLAEFGQSQGMPVGPPLPTPPRSSRPGVPNGFDGPPAAMGLPPGPLPAPPGPDVFGSRIGVYAPDGRLLAGVPLDADPKAALERPVTIEGQVVAWVRMRPIALVPDAVESAFLRRQYLGIAVLAGALLALGLLGARWLAGRWVRPLLDIQRATARIARGELATRLPTMRTDEIGDLIRDINSMAAGLESLESARRRWIAEISHELRTPLTVLRGEIDALAEGVRPLNHDAAVSLREEVLRLGAMVDDLHLLAMADLNALPCYFGECDAVQLTRRVHQRFERRASDLGISLEITTPLAGSLPVFWDSQRMEQVLTNLLDNSLCYTDAPGRIRVTLQQRGERVWLRVDDSKPSVAAADLGRLFDPLYRADAARGRHRGGSGLGLAICAALVRAHLGRITAAASELGGLSIFVDMPVSAEPLR
jgi:two-component system sensor histidine kinase BaeS